MHWERRDGRRDGRRGKLLQLLHHSLVLGVTPRQLSGAVAAASAAAGLQVLPREGFFFEAAPGRHEKRRRNEAEQEEDAHFLRRLFPVQSVVNTSPKRMLRGPLLPQARPPQRCVRWEHC